MTDPFYVTGHAAAKGSRAGDPQPSTALLYGYDSFRGWARWRAGVLRDRLPDLSRLKNERYVDTYIEESPEGPARKYYRLTRSGRNELERMNEHWLRLHDAVGTLRKERAR